jgi:hypothetical protein
MTGKTTTHSPAAAPAAAASAANTTAAVTSTATNPSDPAALLLSILRNVDREVRSSFELGDEAKRAVERYRAIDAILRVRPVAGSAFSAGAARAAAPGAGGGRSTTPAAASTR